MRFPAPAPIGRRFGALTVIKEIARARYGSRTARRVLTKCDCGRLYAVALWGLVCGHPVSCGCLRYTAVAKKMTTHGKSEKPIYSVWQSMISRCTNSKNKRWGCYGGRGIKVSARWMVFENFLKDMGEPSTGQQLDRKNNDGHYCKRNCRWATRSQQANNKSSSRLIRVGAKTLTLAQWARASGINWSTIRTRIENGWSAIDAVTLKPCLSRKYLHMKRKARA